MKLYIFVEGKTDIQFFDRILKQELHRKYDDFECIPFAEDQI